MTEKGNSEIEEQSLPNYKATIDGFFKNSSLKEKNNNEVYPIATEKLVPSEKRAVFAQCVVAGAVLIILIGCGMPIGYSAILLPQLTDPNGAIYIDKEMGSWIAAVHSLAVPIAGLISGVLLDAIGRRGCLQLSTVPLFVGWIIMGYSSSIPYILAGRIILGFAVGLIAVPSQTLTTETANARLRGMLSGTNYTAYTIGILLVYTFGAYFTWYIVAFSCAVVPVVGLIYLFFIPESPTWLVRQNKIEEATEALLWLRGNDIDQVKKEINIMVESAQTDRTRKPEKTSLKKKLSSTMSTICHSGVLKPLFIIHIYTLLQQLTGTYVVVFYGVDILKKVGGESVDAGLASIVTAIVRFVSSFISCFLLYKIGRRSLSIISSLGTAVASFVLAGYLFFKTEQSYMDKYVVAVSVLAYVAFNTVGLFPLPMILLSEMLPTRARAVLGGITYSLFCLILFGVTKAFPTLDESIGMVGVFMMFGISALLLIIFIYLLLPETKDHTLDEIENYFKQDNLLWITRKKEKHPA